MIERLPTKLLPALLLATAALLVSAATAGAADPTGPTGPVTPVKRVSLGIGATGGISKRGRKYVLPRELITLRGSTTADFTDKTLRLEIRRNGRVVSRRNVELKSSGGVLRFNTRWRAPKKGRYTVTANLTSAQTELARVTSNAHIVAVRTDIHRGSTGMSVKVFQRKLKRLKYVVPTSGRFDDGTARAFMAYRKVTGLSRNYTAGATVARKLAAGKGRFHLRYPKAGRHVEVDISKQVMAFASKGRVVRIYHVSTGAPATPTVRGTYHVYRKDWGTNEKGMVHSSYFIRGYAIHGYADVPPYNASHGCVRVPVPNAVSIFNWVRMGTRVDTYW
jgi:hypothetical protein